MGLPADTTSFVGRRRDVLEVKRLLAASRLVTLVGVGGVGKTRVALRVAGELRRAFEDGVWLVELGLVDDPALVSGAFCAALDVVDDSGRDPLLVLADRLRDRHLLVVLDNCEHLLDTCADLLHVLLRAVPGLRVLATTRERIGVSGEHLWHVRPLPSDTEAVTLFAERAVAVQPDFSVTAENRPTVARVCQLLDGIPLAIELAAVGLRALSLDGLLSGLTDRYRLLSSGVRGCEPRHRTLRATVEWSFQLCTPAQQVLWARVSVFAGGFELAAAEQVCADDDLPAAEVRDLVVALVDKSVLMREGPTRFRLLSALRQYGQEVLRELGSHDELLRRHRDCYLALVAGWECDWFGPGQAEISAAAHVERPNLRMALEYSLGSVEGLRLAGSLWFYWVGCGALGEGRHWLDRALAASPTPSPERAKALWVNGYVCTLRGDLESAVARLEESRAYAATVGDEETLAYATHRLGCTALVGDDLEYATTLFAQAHAAYARLGLLNSNVLLATIELAIARCFLGELDQAARLCEDAAQAGERYGEKWAYAYALYVLGLISSQRGEFARAAAYGRSCLRIKWTFNDLLGIALAVEGLASNAAAQGCWAPAATLLGAANQLWRSVGYPLFGSVHFGAQRRESESAARSALGAAAFTAATTVGEAFSLAEAVGYALGEQPEPVAVEEPAEAPLLTRREEQVATLIADGRTNREIAAILVIAQRTAEGHVERVLRKLGFTSRSQVAAWVSARRR